MTGDSSNILGDKRSAELSVIALDQQIAEHKKADDHRSVLGWAVSQIWRSDEGSLSSLEKLSKDVKEAQAKGDTTRVNELTQQITTAVKGDQDSVGLQDEISHYTGGGLKTAALFFGGGKGGFLANRGMVGLATTVGLYGLDEAKMSDAPTAFATNFAFGGAKGGLTKALFQGLGSMPLESPAAKGIVLGMGSRIIDTSLTPSNYRAADGSIDIAQGFGRTLSTATDTKAMLVDAALFSAAHGVTRGANWLTNGAVDARPMYNTIATSASFGLSGGAYTEMQRQIQSGEQFDLGKVATRALLQGGIDMLAGVPGGVNADAHFRQRPWETLKEDGSAIARKFGFLKETGLQQTASEMFAQQPRSIRAATDGAENSGLAAAASVKPVTTIPEIAEASASVKDAKTENVVAPAKRTAETEIKTTETKLAEAEAETKLAEGESKPVETKTYTPEQVAAATAALDAKVGKLTGKEPTFDQVKDITDYLAQHPEGDNYAATLYVRNFANPAIRRAIEAFYKPGFAMQNEVALASSNVREAYERFENGMRDEANRSLLPHVLGGYVKNMIKRAGADGPELREVIEHHARTTFDEVAVRAIDFALGTKYAPELKNSVEHDRTMPLTDKDVEYVRALALGKPLPGGPTRVSGSTELLERLDGLEIKEFASTGAARETAPKAVDLRTELLREAERGLANNLAKEADLLRNGTPEQQVDAATKLADHLAHESAKDWFKDWAELAPNSHVSAAGELANPNVKALIDKAPDAVREYLGSQISEVPLSYRFRALSDIANTFEGKPQVAEEILKIAGNNPDAMRQIGYELTRGFARQQYAQWLENAVIPKDGVAQPAVEQITGDAAVRKARIFSAFGDTPVGKYLEQFAEAQPELAQKLLQKLPRPDAEAKDAGRGGPPKPPRGADLQNLLKEVVEARIAEGVTPEIRPEQLNPELLQMEIRLQNAFRKNPQALEPLLAFAREHLPEVTQLLQMPMTPEAQRIASARAPKGRPDRNDPQVQAQMALKKLGMAYTDFVGMITPKVAELGPQEGLKQLQAVQTAFNDVIQKNAAAARNPDQMQLRVNAEAAERELNRLTDRLLPENDVLRRDAQLRREAIAKQDANLLPNGPPPTIRETKPVAEEETTTPVVEEVKPVVEEPKSVVEETKPVVEETKPVVEETKPVVEEEAPPVIPVIDTNVKITTPQELGVDLVQQNIEAAEQIKQEQYRRRKGKNDRYDGEEDGRGGRGNKGRRGGYRSPRDWREANREEWGDE